MKFRVYIAVSADGYVARADGGAATTLLRLTDSHVCPDGVVKRLYELA